MYDELFITLKKINSKKENPVPEMLLEKILDLVIRYPLEDERKKCQQQIEFVIDQALVVDKL